MANVRQETHFSVAWHSPHSYFTIEKLKSRMEGLVPHLNIRFIGVLMTGFFIMSTLGLLYYAVVEYKVTYRISKFF